MPRMQDAYDTFDLLQGTSKRLTMHLVEEHSVVDPTFIEDFLLTYRTFLCSPMEVGKKLLAQRSPEGPRHFHRIPRLSEAPWEVP